MYNSLLRKSRPASVVTRNSHRELHPASPAMIKFPSFPPGRDSVDATEFWNAFQLEFVPNLQQQTKTMLVY